MQGDHVGLLADVQLGLLAPQPALGLGDSHPLPGTEPDEVALELGHHGQHVEEKPTHRVRRVVDGAAQTELDLPPGEVLDDGPGVGQRPRQSVELGDDEGVAGATGGQRLAQARPLAVGAGQALVDLGPVSADAERGQSISLGGEILFVSRDPGISDQQRIH